MMQRIKVTGVLSGVCVVGLAGGAAAGQCSPGWSGVGGGAEGTVKSLMLTPEGDLIAGGDFFSAGGAPASRIARWDGIDWQGLGTGMFGDWVIEVRATANLPGGDLVAGGTFVTAGFVTANDIARWDGRDWHAMGSGMSFPAAPSLAWGPYALAVLPNGDVVAGGEFSSAGGIAVGHVARWDGDQWHDVGGGVGPGHVYALAVLDSGDLVAGGSFTNAGGSPASRIARWNGSSWEEVGGGIDGRVNALAVLPDGSLVAAGSFAEAGGVPAANVAVWDGGSWGPLGDGVGGMVFALAVLPGGELVAGGNFQTAGGSPASRLAVWDGSGWRELDRGTDGEVRSLAVGGGGLYVGGRFQEAGGVRAPNIAHWCPDECYPDCDGNGVLDFFDFLCFQNAFLAQDPYADCDGDGVLDFFDFLCFQNAFLAGCP